MASIDNLIDEHGEGVIQKAFWLQEHIYEEGIEGIHFTKKAEMVMENTGEKTVSSEIEKNLTEDF